MKIGLFFTAAFLVASAAGALIGVLAFILYLRHRCIQCCRCLPGSSSKQGRLQQRQSSKKRRGQEPISTDATSLDMQAILEQDAHFGGVPSVSNTSQESEDYESVSGIRDEVVSIANTEEDSHRYSSLHFKPWPKDGQGELTPLAILMAVPESIRRTLNFSGTLKKSSNS